MDSHCSLTSNQHLQLEMDQISRLKMKCGLEEGLEERFGTLDIDQESGNGKFG